MFSELHMENIFEIRSTIESVVRLHHQSPWEDSKDMFADALNWALEFEDQYEDNGDYYNAIDEFTRGKMKDKFKEYYAEG